MKVRSLFSSFASSDKTLKPKSAEFDKMGKQSGQGAERIDIR